MVYDDSESPENFLADFSDREVRGKAKVSKATGTVTPGEADSVGQPRGHRKTPEPGRRMERVAN